ncbi:DNA replication terminus site-binding protein (plasmid) [Catenovulum sp. SX2]|uniref:DNA replication terminus site-binding protein n=1 Tax=Catenovulum sp. SX2 TaxID=3398614 RepID=UPI003F83679B
MEHVNFVRAMFNELTAEITSFQSELTKHQQSITTFAYQLGPLSLLNKSPSSFTELENLSEVFRAYSHFDIEAGENGKFVHRYPGVVAVRNDSIFESLTSHIISINNIKKSLHDYITQHGKPTYIVDENKKSTYVKNDLLFSSLPMKNHLMLTRHIEIEDEKQSSVSFSWNIDFIHRKIAEHTSLINSLINRIGQPEHGLSQNFWQSEIENLIDKIEQHVQQGITLKIIDPKPVEPMVFFAGSKKRVKAKLPMLVRAAGNFSCKKTLTPPPIHPLEIKKGRGNEYKRLSKHFYIYACF